MAERLSIIVPCYNESPTLRTIIRRVLDAPPHDLPKEIVVVDDCSTDGSREILRELEKQHAELRVLYHERNQGKGAAIRTGQKACTGDIVLIQDADLEYDPQCYPDLLEPIRKGLADVVYGSRFGGGRSRRVLLFWHEVGNRALTCASNVTTNLNLTDMETCYKVFRGEYFRQIPINSNRFGFEPEITAKVAKLGLRVYEVPIDYHGRSYLEGKKITWKDGVKALITIFWYWVFDGMSGMGAGVESLLTMRHARRYNRWVVRRIRPHIGRRVVETSAGVGNITAYLVDRERVVAVDNDPFHVGILKLAFANNPNVRVESLDLTDPAAREMLRGESPDTVLCVNVLEHIEPDLDVLRAFHEILVPGGRVVVLVPHGPWLFGTMDRRLGHLRRYTRRDLRAKMTDAGFEVETIGGINRAGTLGWFVNGKILKRKALPCGQIRIFDSFITAVRALDFVLPLPHLSLIAVGRKR